MRFFRNVAEIITAADEQSAGSFAKRIVMFVLCDRMNCQLDIDWGGIKCGLMLVFQES